MNWTGPSHRNRAALLAFLSALGILLVVAIHLLSQLRDTVLPGALARTPTESPTFFPTKLAFAVYSPTPTPSNTPTITPSSTSTPTRKPTSTSMPTRTPTFAPTPKATPLPTTMPTPTATIVSVGERYSTLAVNSSPSDHSAAQVELSLAARGFAPVTGTLDLVNLEGPADAGAPQLYLLFADERAPALSAVYQINGWDWDCNCASTLIGDPTVTMAGLTATQGEIIRVPRSSYYIGDDYQALVLYAENDRITFNYTRSGNPVRGYTIYLEGIAVDSTLVALYQQMDSAGRSELPALQAGQGIGRARGKEIKMAIRDAGAFLDPRSRKDWWRGK